MIDVSIYQNDPRAQELLKGAEACALANTMDPRVIYPQYGLLRRAVSNIPVVGIIGPAQTGKSTAVMKLSHEMGYPFFVIVCDDGFSSANVFGRYIPNPNEGVNGDTRKLIWQDGYGVIAAQNGFGLNFEEFFNLPTEKTSPLMKLLDDTPYFDLPDGRTIRKHPNFRVVLTGNPNYTGNRKLNEALISRIRVVFWPTELPEAGFKVWVKTKFPFMNDQFSEATYRLSKAIESEAERNGKRFSCGVRQTEAFLKMTNNDALSFQEFKDLVELTFFNGLGVAQIEAEAVRRFESQPVIDTHVKIMHKEYINSLAAANKSQTATPQPQPSVQTQQQKGGSRSGEDLLSAMMGVKI